MPADDHDGVNDALGPAALTTIQSGSKLATEGRTAGYEVRPILTCFDIAAAVVGGLLPSITFP